MSKVVSLPTAVIAPPPTRRWRGRYPKGVVPISKPRLKRQREERERRIEQYRAEQRQAQERVKIASELAALFSELSRLSALGDVIGVVGAIHHADGRENMLTVGSYRGDSARPIDVLTKMQDLLEAQGC